MSKVTVEMNYKNIAQLTENHKKALVQAVDAAKTDLIQSKTVPFDVGTMQNSIYINESGIDKGQATIVTEAFYAKRLYFGSGFNFQKTKNPNAGSHWFEPYIRGTKKQFLQNAYSKRLKALNARSGK